MGETSIHHHSAPNFDIGVPSPRKRKCGTLPATDLLPCFAQIRASDARFSIANHGGFYVHARLPRPQGTATTASPASTPRRPLRFVLVAIAIVATALHFGTQPRRAGPRAVATPATPDPLAEELKRCQLIADQAKDDPACDAAWAESRRRFFTCPLASAPTPATNASR